ncbi:MAG: 4-(cytidine 5'-diphospho)-2-C-methyl-D-erythritol kinase [Steroidobacteraceae bacterium]|nr:4-(cytidine 5'-diphospho)-2-C-methyl-D-erythritol kinase [Steroidobacteraceae bacterium]
MTAAETWPAPAKLNLFLHVTGRRPDGYHELDTLFQLVDLRDEVAIQPRDDGVIERRRGAAGVPPEADLVVRAARALRDRAGRPELGATLDVVKRIPLGGGLGGGSSDAATVLVALNALWSLDLPVDELERLGLKLGADVPVFVRGLTARAGGVGERLEPFEVPPAWFAVIHPGIGVPTAGVFQAPELTRNAPPATIRGSLPAGWTTQPLPGRNDLEPVVRARHPEVAAALARLGRHGEARLTGSGACVFAAFATEAEARAASADLDAGWQGWAVAGLARSPLLARLERARRAVAEG